MGQEDNLSSPNRCFGVPLDRPPNLPEPGKNPFLTGFSLSFAFIIDLSTSRKVPFLDTVPIPNKS